MTLDGKKTKAGAVIVALAGALVHLSLAWAFTALCVGLALALYGLYDRQNKNSGSQGRQIAAHVAELSRRIKKPLLRSV